MLQISQSNNGHSFQSTKPQNISLVRNSRVRVFFHFLCISCNSVGYVHVLTPNLCLDGQQSPQSSRVHPACCEQKQHTRGIDGSIVLKETEGRGKKKENQSVFPAALGMAWMHWRRYGDHWSGRAKKYFDMAFLNLFLY